MDKRVLVVDDDPFVIRLLEKYLRQTGYEVLKASDGREALRIVLAEAPPIVITDWIMPDMDGIELCRALRTHEGVRFVYVIMVTAQFDIERLVQAFDSGADDFMPKPVNREELMARIHAGERICKLENDLARRQLEIHRLNAEMAVANEKLALMNEKLHQLATIDGLTGLLNRREAMERLQQAWAASIRYGHPLTCIMMDIDHFKKFNDTYGHAAGDHVLREVAAAVRQNVRQSDVVCRVGGEEFLIICPHVPLAGGAACAEHIRAAIESGEFRFGNISLAVTMSAGVACASEDANTPDALLRRADEALYESKGAGRNRVTMMDQSMAARRPVPQTPFPEPRPVVPAAETSSASST